MKTRKSTFSNRPPQFESGVHLDRHPKAQDHAIRQPIICRRQRTPCAGQLLVLHRIIRTARVIGNQAITIKPSIHTPRICKQSLGLRGEAGVYWRIHRCAPTHLSDERSWGGSACLPKRSCAQERFDDYARLFIDRSKRAETVDARHGLGIVGNSRSRAEMPLNELVRP